VLPSLNIFRFAAKAPGKRGPLGDVANEASCPSLAEILCKPPLSYIILDGHTPVGGCALRVPRWLFHLPAMWHRRMPCVSSLTFGASLPAVALADDIANNTAIT
jgi:hypothetical protein